MKQRSKMFVPGQQVAGTCYKVVDSVDPLSWKQVIVQCICGKQEVLQYADVYRGKYSCGCRRKPRADQAQAAELSVHSDRGNKDEQGRPALEGRRLTIISRDPETQRWWYLCDCCGELFLLPGGQSHGVETMLRKLAAETCPNYKRFYPAAYDRMQGLWPVELGDLCAKVLNKQTLMPEQIVRYYKDPGKSVVRDKFGFITGFKGLPDSDEFNALREKYRQSVIDARNKRAAPSARQERELPHEDEFAEADY
jgi:hypothetical protein